MSQSKVKPAPNGDIRGFFSKGQTASTSSSQPKPATAKKEEPSPRKIAPLPKPRVSAHSRKTKPKDEDFIEILSDEDGDEEDDDEVVKKGKRKSHAPAKKPAAKSVTAKSTPAKSTPAKSAAKPRAEAKKPAKDEDVEMEGVKPAKKLTAKSTPEKSASKPKAEEQKPKDTDPKAEEETKPAKKPKCVSFTLFFETPESLTCFMFSVGMPPKLVPDHPTRARRKSRYLQIRIVLRGLRLYSLASSAVCLETRPSSSLSVMAGAYSTTQRCPSLIQSRRRITGQPSSKTSYVVVGADAGPSKLKAIEKNKLKTLDEDGFLKLIATRVTDESALDEKTRKKIQKERETIRESAKEMERREKQAAKENAAHGSYVFTHNAAHVWDGEIGC